MKMSKTPTHEMCLPSKMLHTFEDEQATLLFLKKKIKTCKIVFTRATKRNRKGSPK